ncbi:AAA family ATPase [Conexibacter sp. W3-3-2]|uniref:ATP-binding protein n=1 Tax=Conexibacter sp. W3-3-2 TaxID=2675227 RepID=UPI0012B9951A|nr:ATP-binding protein [Conexibacter sp. W3-3-2]MTD45068.1 AAA family ATPase [Conexibacter sp. W3-3-2]
MAPYGSSSPLHNAAQVLLRALDLRGLEPPLGASPSLLTPHVGPEEEARLVTLATRLGLDELETAILATSVLVELVPPVGEAVAVLAEGAAGPLPTPWALELIAAADGHAPVACREALAGTGTLRATGALRIPPAHTFSGSPIVLARAVGDAVRGSTSADPVGRAALVRVDPPGAAFGRTAVAEHLRDLLAERENDTTVVVRGAEADRLCAAATPGGALVAVADTLADGEGLADFSIAAALEGRLPVVRGLGALPVDRRESVVRQILHATPRPVVWERGGDDAAVLGDQTVVRVPIPAMGVEEATRAWCDATGGTTAAGEVAHLRLTYDEIRQAVRVARAGAREGSPITGRALRSAATAISSRGLDSLAETLPRGPRWEDIVLAPRTQDGLRAVDAFLRNHDRLRSTPAYDRYFAGRGLTALFAGPPGTGKTLAARVAAGEADRDVFRVDLSTLYSRWVGEMEKQLDRLFAAADGTNSVLFFDEADVVFGKRGDAGDGGAADRYANLGTAYLLQRIETFDGVVILATNFLSNVDPAFMRRVDVLVDFPEPDAATRLRLWSQMLDGAGIDDLPAEDVAMIAERFELTGGSIRNCVVAAVLFAADEGRRVETLGLMRAIALEHRKLGRLVLAADFGAYHRLLPGSAEAHG